MPYTLSYCTLKEQVVTGFSFAAKQAGFVLLLLLPNSQVISSKQFILREQPKKDMHSRGYGQFPHCGSVDLFHATKTHNLVKGLGRVNPV